MKYRQLGQTNMNVSLIAVGCSGFGGVYGPVNEIELSKVVKSAIKNGINYFDTSPFYGKFTSETILGKCLSSIPRHKYYLSTKCGRYAKQIDKQESVFDFSYQTIIKSVKDSLKRMKVDYFDIVYCHDVEFGDDKQIIREALPALESLRQEGLVKYIGISGLPLPRLDYFLCNSNIKIDVVLSYCHDTLHSNLLDKYAEIQTNNPKYSSIGLVSASPIAMGLFTRKGPPEQHPASKQLRALARKASDYCDSKKLNISNVALRHCFSNKHVSTVLTGILTISELEEAIQCLNSETPEKILFEIKSILSPVKNTIWKQKGVKQLIENFRSDSENDNDNDKNNNIGEKENLCN